jgi:transcriptional regulator with XRE-family HTH domain
MYRDVMRLSRWIYEQQDSQRQIAVRLGISQPYLSMLCSDKRRPSLTTLERIEELTEGEVTLRDFVHV